MALTVTAIRNAMPAERTRRLSDANGLYLEISPSGGKWWPFKYRLNRREKRLSLSVVTDVSLKVARERRDEARNLIANGVGLSERRKAVKAAGVERVQNSFELVALEWFAKKSVAWKPSHSNRILSQLKREVFPWIGNRPIAEISAPELSSVMQRIEQRGAIESAHRTLSSCGQVFRSLDEACYLRRFAQRPSQLTDADSRHVLRDSYIAPDGILRLHLRDQFIGLGRKVGEYGKDFSRICTAVEPRYRRASTSWSRNGPKWI